MKKHRKNFITGVFQKEREIGTTEMPGNSNQGENAAARMQRYWQHSGHQERLWDQLKDTVNGRGEVLSEDLMDSKSPCKNSH
jgi:hypothetical protein